MNPDKIKRLESHGWKVGSSEEFLGLTDEEIKIIEKVKTTDMNYYLVKYRDSWKDELYVEGLMLLDEHSKEFFSSLTGEHLPLNHFIGENIEIEYNNLCDLLKCYTWTPISKEEYRTLEKYIGQDFGHFYYPILKDEQYI